ncbi:hypothetical protein ACFQ60_03515 [Streptomyces zhihengii]
MAELNSLEARMQAGTISRNEALAIATRHQVMARTWLASGEGSQEHADAMMDALDQAVAELNAATKRYDSLMGATLRPNVAANRASARLATLALSIAGDRGPSSGSSGRQT